MVKATSPDGASSFTAYTYAGELPTCAFGFNSNGVVRVLYVPIRSARRTRLDCHERTIPAEFRHVQAFTLDSVPPAMGEVAAGAIAVNFVSRDLLEARDLDDAMHRVCSPGVSVGHCYNLMDVGARRIVTIETASRNRFAVHETGPVPSFHANMYRHLQVEQVDMISTAQQALHLSER